jgi:hypothetical protein
LRSLSFLSFTGISTLEWKRRAERAERLVIELVDERHRGEIRGIERKGQRARLQDDLQLLTDNNPPLDKDVNVEYLVIRRLNKGKDWVSVDFVDGDVEDEYEWCEGPFHQQTTIRELFGKKHRYDRHIRRRISGRKKVPLGDPSEDSVDENGDDSSSSQTDEDEVSERSEQAGKSDDEKESASDGTEDYDHEGSSCAEAPNRWEEEKARRQRRGGTHHGVGLASFLRDEPVQKKNISPELKRLKWIRTKPWRRDFRERVKPGIPGVDADTLFERERSRLANVSRYSSSNGDESHNRDMKEKGRFIVMERWVTCTHLDEGSH